MRWIRGVLVALMLPCLMLACSASPSVHVPAPTQVPDAQIRAQSHGVSTLLDELHRHFLIGEGGGSQYISAGATPALAAAELGQAIGLGAQALRFALSTATELSRTTSAGEFTEVEFEVRDVVVLGGHDGRVIVATTVWQQLTPQRGPIQEQSVTYAVGWRGEELASVESLVMAGGERGLDGAVGLSSPRGAVHRYVELVRQRDFEAVRELSGGVNANQTTLEVLASVVNSTREVFTVSLPQVRLGSVHVVYLINSADLVIGRFEVTLSTPTQVVFIPTA